MAPELLRHHLLRMPYMLTPQADIYALGIVLKELLCQNAPYSEERNLTPKGRLYMHVLYEPAIRWRTVCPWMLPLEPTTITSIYCCTCAYNQGA